MRKKCFKLLLAILSFALLGNDFDINSRNPFSYTVLTQTNFDDGNSLFVPESHRNLFNKQKVNRMTVREINNGRERLIGSFVYRNGLISIDASPSDDTLSAEYEYDDKRRLVRHDRFLYEYPESDSGQFIERVTYFNGAYQKTERVEAIPSGYRVSQVNTGGSMSADFIFENSLLKEVNTFLRGNPLLRYIFEYENGDLKEIKLITSRGVVSSTRTVTERSGGNIISMEFGTGTVSTYKFYDYDRYGNWGTAERYTNNVLVEKTIRDIEYVD